MIFSDPTGYTLSELNSQNHQVKSVRSRTHSSVHWTLSLTPEFVFSTSKLVNLSKLNTLIVKKNIQYYFVCNKKFYYSV